MLPIVGIDLGTTFSAIAYLEKDGRPQVIRDVAGKDEIPSVLCFGGGEAWVGEKAELRKFTTPHDIYELWKRDVGKGVQATGHGDPLEVAPYEIGGYRYGAAGLSAILLRYLKKQAIRHFRGLKLTEEKDDTRIPLRAVITVPAYFGERERRETRLAGHAAGLEVIGILNEPTAAALALGLTRDQDQTLLVFDLGGGTFDVTVLRMRRGEAEVLATRGDHTLGGRDFDELIEKYLVAEAHRQTGVDFDEAAGFAIQKLARQAKHALTEASTFQVTFTHAGEEIELLLHRARPPAAADEDQDLVADETSPPFYFEERATNLLQRCRALCEAVLAGVDIDGVTGRRSAGWHDLDEIVLAGGSSKMPMVGDLLERLSGRRIRRRIEGFGHDTAVAVGAALYGSHREKVHDVLSHGLGIKVERGGRQVVDFLLEKDTPIPCEGVRTYHARVRAELEVREGESTEPDECSRRGRLELGNEAEGPVLIRLAVDADGCVRVKAELAPNDCREMEIRDEHFADRGRAEELRRRIQKLILHV